MAGATKCYEARLEDGELQYRYVEFSPHYADKPSAAVDKVRAGDVVKIAPSQWIKFLQLWEGEKAVQP